MSSWKYVLLMPLFAVLLAFGPDVQAQPTTDQQLAAHYFQNGEFDKAAIYYEKLYDQSQTDFFYGYYLKCLLQLEDYKEAEKLARKQIKRYPSSLKYMVDLGSLYEKQEDPAKARQQYEKALKKLAPNQSQITALAKAFVQANETEYALETYQRGQKLLKGSYPFAFELAELYGTMGDYNAMVSEYLNLLEINTKYLQSVQNSLNRSMTFDRPNAQNELLRTELLKRVQRQPDKTVFAEMLIWMFLQQQDFNSAFIQVKALDKRLGEEGDRLMALAKLCSNNKNYDVAIKAYQTVIDKGPDNYNYMKGKIELLQVMNDKITTGRYTQAEIKDLERNYATTVDEFNGRSGSVKLLQEWARLHAYYLQNPDTAVTILERALKVPGLRPQEQAQVKLDLGDIPVIQNNIWDASLYYAQVDKAFKYDELGQEAKFRNARIYYYDGQFEFARGMLNVLKGSTSKLIAKDALQLSLLITDNTGIDTTTTPMLMFARADLLVAQHRFDAANVVLDSINDVYPGHALDDEILMQRYKMAYRLQDYEKAATHLQRIIDSYSYDILADDALFRLGELNEYIFEEKEKAKELYQQLMLDHPGSLYAVEARKRFRALRGDKLN